MKKIGFFGGTFDPIHFGHLNLAVQVLEKKKWDEIWFCPAQLNPFKQNGETSGHHRLAMVNLAIAPFPKFRSLDLELQRQGPSYTIDTIRTLLEMDKNQSEIGLILGDDTIHQFAQWKEAEELVRLVPLVIGVRHPEKEHFHSGNPRMDEALKKGCLETSLMEISATQVRDRLKNGLPCSHLVPKEVLDYIREFRLYSKP